MAQHARPNVIGHMLDSRAQAMPCSSVVTRTFSSLKRPSSQPMIFDSSQGLRPWLLCAYFLFEGLFGFHGGFPVVLIGAHPVDIATSPDVREADHQDAKEYKNVKERDLRPVPRDLRRDRHG